MATQGAIQLDVVINGVSFAIEKKHLNSLKVTRVMGDSANEFTLEVFDETAYQIEALLSETININNGSNYASISIRYSAANSFGDENEKDSDKAVYFSGVCYDYQLTFIGRSTMLSLSGLLSYASTSIGTTAWWFENRTICWCGFNPYHVDGDPNSWYIDGKSPGEWANYENNEDVCAILAHEKADDGTESEALTPYFNPARIFKRIIRKYGKDYPKSFFLGTVDDTQWVKGLDTIQRNETAATYITRVLCKSAVSIGDIAGYNYICDNEGHHFKCIDYSPTKATTISLQYGYKNSDVISFSASNVGALVMANAQTAADGSLLGITDASLDKLSGETTASVNRLGNVSLTAVSQEEAAGGGVGVDNWYFTPVRPTQIKSSSTADSLSKTQYVISEKLRNLCFEATLTLWGRYSNRIKPGYFIDLTSLNFEGKQHYTSGIYFILEVVDEVSSSGYIQTLSLLKNVSNAYSSINGVTSEDTTSNTNTEEEESKTVPYTALQTRDEAKKNEIDRANSGNYLIDKLKTDTVTPIKYDPTLTPGITRR